MKTCFLFLMSSMPFARLAWGRHLHFLMVFFPVLYDVAFGGRACLSAIQRSP